MRATALLTIVAFAVSLPTAAAAAAAAKPHRHHVRHAAEIAKSVPAPADSRGSSARSLKPHECVTDEGGGRFFPCNYGGGMP